MFSISSRICQCLLYSSVHEKIWAIVRCRSGTAKEQQQNNGRERVYVYMWV